MDLSNLKPAKGSVRKNKRIGRGQGSGHGGTSTRGHKGANSRSGNKKKHHFEGGQMPLQRRVPKRGFKNPNTVEYTTLNLDQIQEMADKYGMTGFDQEILMANGVIGRNDKLKVLGRGELKAKVDIHAHAFSKTAKAAIEALGGTANVIG
ncbi:MAG: 50S ribosomal protein L15 [Chitinophagales bacterium]|nr:50S ribosomal protein L15 [Chitinophagales bacterium]HAE13720.1 50S ribosomal protein L15 [Bacteroidota bacterium]MCB9022066.1 50S ribosomal protein L15 [Chitinophagales bacterium]MCB9031795.1 50S ribosomal protein L15 [Chitinophagales bacterium]HPE96643.1 50S ribosomal protein L15 [Chitinophagales bacterium]